MPAVWTRAEPLPANDKNALFDVAPYRHWLIHPERLIDPDPPGCAAPPGGVYRPFVLTIQQRPDSDLDRERLRGLLGSIAPPGLGLLEFGPSFMFDGIMRDLVAGLPATVPLFADETEIGPLAQSIAENQKDELIIRLSAIGMPLPTSMVPARASGATPDEWSGHVPTKLPERVVAVIDADIPFLHDRFRKSPDETRIAYFWNQEPGPEASAPFLLGRELYDTEIDALLGRMHDEHLSEAEIYGSVREDWYAPGSPGFRRRPLRSPHGAHVLDLAAGKALADVAPGDAAIFAVSLPGWVLERTNGAFLFPYVLLAIERIRDRVKQLSIAVADSDVPPGDVPMPQIYFNLSLGGVSGRHDGLSQFERYLDAVVARPEVAALTVAGGNARGLDLHAELPKAALEGAGAEIGWRIRPHDGTESILQVWLPEGANLAAGLTLRITPPGDLPEQTFVFDGSATNIFHEFCDGCAVLARLYLETDRWYDFPPVGLPIPENPRQEITLIVRHTAQNRMNLHYSGGIPDLAGTWRIRLSAGAGLLQPDEALQVWVERDDPLDFATTGARQSHLEEGDGFVTDGGTLSDIATGAQTIVAASHRRLGRAMSDFSGEGFSFFQTGQKIDALPTLSAPGEISTVRAGLRGAGYFSGSVWRSAGTSMAAAMVTRHVSGGAGTLALGAPVKAQLVNEATVDEAANGGGNGSGPNRFGAGRIARIDPPRD